MKIAFVIAGALIIFILLVLLVQVLWNWLIPELFRGPKIRFKHALGIVILSRLLFGFGFGGRFPAYYWRQHNPDSVGKYWFDHHRNPDVIPNSNSLQSHSERTLKIS
jgi:hypothetical protein